VISHLVSLLLLAAMPVSTEDGSPSTGIPGPLDQQLRREDPAALARDARRLGDARRGALVFHQPALTCTRCHLGERADAPPPLGPDLAAMGKEVSGVDLVESILEPSKAIKKGYETVTIATDDGRTVTGLLAEEQPDAVVLRDPGQVGKPIAIARIRIERQSRGGPSLMPAGLVNALGSRQQFLDLVRYLMEIAEHGPARARALRPDPALVAPPLPDYERTLNHAGLIAGLGPDHVRRGAAIYNRVCANCHGTKDQPGSLPAAPRFASATLKNGGDPYAMYRVLTDGFGQMAPQTWMVPRQKYDVIHYIREVYLKPDNPGQYARVDRVYLDRLPRGTSQGPDPSGIEPWVMMDYGPSLTATYEISTDGSNFAYKGIAVRLDPGQGGVSRGHTWVVYDHDTLRLAAAWTGQGFIDWNGINFNGRHQVHPRIVGRVHTANPDGPGWANPDNQGFADQRLRGRDGRRYGPLPRSWTHYQGLYRHGGQVILAYTIGTTRILETPGREIDPAQPDIPIFTRTLEVGPSPTDLMMRVAPDRVAISLVGDRQACLLRRDGFTMLRVPRSGSSLVIKVLMSSGGAQALDAYATASLPATALEPFTHGGPRQWSEVLETRAVIGRDDGPFAVNVLTVPDSNPWLCQMRLSGFDFLPGGRHAAVCTWDGDVWRVGGVDEPARGLTWQRIASGLFQPLGLKVVGGQIYVGCRDQIVCLRDLNGDGETDYYESFNSDHQVTEHFHEFAMGLQADAEGSFYYAKAARHGLTAVVPQHGTLLRVSRDGGSTEILATGFRAANGVCLNPDATFFLSDQEGFWLPKNRINWVRRGGFYGNMWGYHDVTDTSDDAMEPPVCWITNAFDRSPAELIRVESTNPAWSPLRGALLSLS
jgi:putative heme-binding domain-containing protein